MQRTELDLQAGPGGWGKASISRDGELEEVYLRWRRTEDGAWKQQGTLYAPPLSPEKLRTIPLRRILLAAEASGTFRSDLEKQLTKPAPEPGSPEFRDAFETGFYHDEPKPLPKLKRPRGRRLPDDFYAAVADLYREAAARGLNPRTAVAEQAGTSTEVAGRWVREARKRGQLPPTDPGKVEFS